MLLHENDTNVHFSLIFDALQTAQTEGIELNRFKVANDVIKSCISELQ
jgi:hypothetical protein